MRDRTCSINASTARWRRRSRAVACGRDVGVEQRSGERDRADAVFAGRAAPEDDARHEAKDVVAPRRDDAFVEVVEIEDDAVARLVPLFERVLVGAVSTEVFEVQIARNPANAGRTAREIGTCREDLVEERRRAAQERERRDAHALDLALEDAIEALGSLTIACELALGERSGGEVEHVARIARRRLR